MNTMKEKTEIYTLSSDVLRVRVCNVGARVLSFEYDGTDMLYGPKTPDELREDTCYCGAVCGRVANRIAGGRFLLDGQEYTLAVNNGPNHLHGGKIGFSDIPWEVESADSSRIVLSLISPDGDEGYPGTVTVRAVYTLQGNKLTLDLQGVTDAPTLLNLTNHAYWNLNGQGTMDDHYLQVHATAYTPMVANIPTGAILPVSGSLYDLTTPACLGERNAPDTIAGGYDDNYVLPTVAGVKEVAVLSNGKYTLRLSTDAPGLQVYTGDYLPLKRGGVALEAQNFPDSPHQPHFPSIELRPGRLYARTIVWSIE
ncbi:MAG: galactose mutarotase [Akkermansia sp.]|nr:galactose mutarotase [Akkermansia sp.]